MDLTWLRELAHAPGPFASVYLDASHDTPDAGHEIALRWRELRAELSDQGADQATLSALDAAVERAEPAEGRVGRVQVAARGEVLLDHSLPDPPDRTRARFGPLPDLLPMLVALPEPVSAVVVVADRNGADIHAPGGREEHVEVAPHPVHKVRGGGWKHLKMQHRVEETWKQTAAEIADAVHREVSRVSTELALHPDELAALGASAVGTVDAAAALVRAAAGTGASLEVVGADELDGDVPALTDGVGALLRYPEQTHRP